MNSGALAAGGYKVLPDDFGPVRTVGNSGWLIRCPADVKLRRTASGVQWQSPPILPEERLLGYKTFSGMYVDLILNSGYPKLCCGLRLYYPKHIGLMMKDLPNRFYHYPERTFTVWRASRRRSTNAHRISMTGCLTTKPSPPIFFYSCDDQTR